MRTIEEIELLSWKGIWMAEKEVEGACMDRTLEYASAVLADEGQR